MRCRIVIDVDERERYVIAKYFGDGTRATRTQVRAFAAGAVRSAVRAHADAFGGRQRATAARLRTKGAEGEAGAELAMPREYQLNLLDGAKE